MWYSKGHRAYRGADGLCLQEAYESVVEYFGENPKTTSPSMFFSLFSRFTKAYKVQVSDGWGAGLCSLCLRALGTASVGEDGEGEGLFSPRPALGPQKAEQEVEQWKKEAAADTSGREEPPAPKVGGWPQARGWDWGT